MHMNKIWGDRQKELADAGFRKPTRDEAALMDEARRKVNQMKGRSDKNDPMAHLPQAGLDVQSDGSPMASPERNFVDVAAGAA